MGRWNIKRVGGHWVSMYMDDWFNTVAHLPFLRLMILMATFYILLVFAFALMYLAFSDKCGMDFNDKIEAYYFSLETMATIGYGTQDYFFGHCWEPLVIINLQVTASLVVESLYFGIIFHRVSRGRNRTNTVLFSDKAVIRRVGDAFYLVFQVCELRRHHLLDARVRVFAVRHERDAHGTAYYQAHRLTLRRPNDATGGMLLMALPQLVVHRLDAASPLVPGTTWMARDGLRTWAGLAAPPETEPPRPNFAATTPRTNSPQKRRGRTSPVPTHRHSRRPSADIKMFVPHVRRRRSAVSGHAAPATHHESPFRVPRRPGLLSRALDRAFDDGASEVPFEEHPMSSPEPSTPDVDHDQFCSPRKVSDADRPRSASPREHRGAHPLGARIGAHPPGAHPLDARRTISDELPPPPPPPGTAKSLEEGLRLARDEGVRREIEAFFEDRDVEIVGIVEGNDEITGRLSQARHSYALEDLGWWRNFAPCVFREKSGSCLVDFGEFHRVV
mmetsp:Transcript_27365/g.94592  ORF Transcript_27365/g.94592 Transcript_27365/m.94592 type:complete len:502 (+) Transcript_27365:92-1597(+)